MERTIHILLTVNTGVLSETWYGRKTRNIRAPRPRKTLPSAGNTTSAVYDIAGRVVLVKNPLLALGHPDKAQQKIELYTVDSVAGLKLGPGRKNLHHFRYRMRLRGYSPESDLEYSVDEVPQCHASTAT